MMDCSSFKKCQRRKSLKCFLEAWVVFHSKNVSNLCISIKINDISRTVLLYSYCLRVYVYTVKMS